MTSAILAFLFLSLAGNLGAMSPAQEDRADQAQQPVPALNDPALVMHERQLRRYTKTIIRETLPRIQRVQVLADIISEYAHLTDDDIKEQNENLRTGIETNDPELVNHAFARYVNMSAVLCNKEHPLAYAVAKNHSPEIIEALLKHKADPNMQREFAYGPDRKHFLLELVENIRTAQLLLEYNANPLSINIDGYNPLSSYYYNSHSFTPEEECTLVRTLIAGKANINYRNQTTRNGNTPLHDASDCGRRGFMFALLEGNADPNAIDHQGKTSLHNIVRAYPRTEEESPATLARLIIEYKANPHIKDAFGESALDHTQCTPELREIILEAYNKKQINERDAKEETEHSIVEGPDQLKVALQTENYKLVANALTSANPEGEIFLDVSPLIYAVRAGVKPEIIKLLLEHRASPNQREKEGGIPLLHRVKSARTARLLLEHKACVNDTSIDADETALFSYRRSLHNFPHNFPPEEQYNVANILIESGANIHHRNAFFRDTALHSAALVHFHGCMQALLAAKADPNARNVGGGTPLHRCTETSRIETKPIETIVRTFSLLIDACADIFVKDNTQRTPLDNAINIRPELGETMLMIYYNRRLADAEITKESEEHIS